MDIEEWLSRGHTQPPSSVQFSGSVMTTPWTAARQASLAFTISRSLLKLMSIESVMPANHLASVVPFSCLQSFPASGFFQQVTSSSQLAKIRSFIFSISPPNELIFFRIDWNIQGWFPLGLTGLITLLPKGLSKVFSSTTVWKHQFFSASLNFRSYFWGKKSNSEFNWITSTSDGGERQI